MKKSLFILLLNLCCLSLSVTSQSQCSSTFAKTIGSALSSESGYSLAVDSTHKVIYVGGSINDSTMLLKVNADGDILWARTFDAVAGQIERIGAVIMDSDGMLCIAGMTDDVVGGKAFLVKYDPQLDQVLWANEYRVPSTNYVFGLIEKGAGGNYLMFNNQITPNNAEILEIDRNTGQVNPNFSKHYSLGASQTFWDLVLYQGALYSTGRFTEGAGLGHMRNVLIKMDPDNGTPIWTKLGHRPSNVSARLYGTDLLVDQNMIFSTSRGDPNGTNLSVSKMYIHKTSLDGEVLWTKQYEIPAAEDVCEEIITTGDGLVIMGRTTGPNSLFLFKINYNGDVLWGKSFDFPGNENTFSTGGTGTQLLAMDGSLYFTAWTELNGRRDMIFVKTDSKGQLDNGCTIGQSIDIPVITVENATFYPIEPEVFTLIPEVIKLQLPFATTSLQTENTCFNPGNIETTIEAAICEGGTYEGYHLAGTYTDTFHLEGGCDSVRIINLRLVSCDPLVEYNLNACTSNMSTGSNMDYSEFIPFYPASDICASVEATNLFRSPPQENKHSCTQGLNDTPAMCVSALSGCTWIPGHQASVIMEITITPEANGISEITGLQFHEKAPTSYNWIDGDSGPNNYPTLFGIRILKNGTEIYRNPAIPTTPGWSLHEFNFIDNALFEVNQATLFRIELLPYCPVGNGAAVAAWDLEDIVLSGGCVILPGKRPSLQGTIVTPKGNALAGAEVHLSHSSQFTVYNADASGTKGEYQFPNLESGTSYYVRGFHNSEFLRGVNTLDLILMQKYLLGITPFTSLDQYVAADINHDGRINIMDLISLRKTILGYTPNFPGNTSWRFGVWPQSFDSSDPSSLNETVYIESIQDGPTKADFVGIKIGDLNGTATTITRNANNGINNSDAVGIAIEDYTMIAGVPFTITVRATEDIIMEGLQLGWQFNGMSLSGIQGIHLSIHEENVSFQEDGAFRLSWNSDTPVHLNTGDVLFSLTLVSHLDETLYSNIRQAPELLPSEMYTDNITFPVKLNVLPSSVTNVPAISFFTVTPNPFTDETTLHYTLSHDSEVKIKAFDGSGILRYGKTIQGISGENTIQISAEDLNQYSGMLFCQIICDGDIKVRKVVRVN